MRMALRKPLTAGVVLAAALLPALRATAPACAQDQSQVPSFVDERRLPEDADSTSKERESQERVQRLKEESERPRERLSAESEARRKAKEEATRKRVEEEERARQAAVAERKAAEEAVARKRAEEEERTRQAADAKREAAEAKRNTAADDLAQRMSSIGSCENIDVTANPQAAGRIAISIKAACLAGRNVSFDYAGHEFVRAVGGDGALSLTLDLFEGAAPLSLKLDDGTSKAVDVSGVELAGISKVAILWSAPVNLDLHAFEYLAPRDGPGHVWSKAPSTLDTAVTAAREGTRGRGFISMDDTGTGPGLHSEVYTFLHNKSQRSGAITLMIDYETRGDLPSGDHCGTGKLAQIEALVVRLRPGGNVEKESVRLPAAPCGQKLPQSERFNSDTLSDLVAKG